MTPRVRLYACIAAANHGTTIKRIVGQARSDRDVAARREVWRKLRDDGFSLTQIGMWTNRHHSSVLFGLRRGG